LLSYGVVASIASIGLTTLPSPYTVPEDRLKVTLSKASLKSQVKKVKEVSTIVLMISVMSKGTVFFKQSSRKA
jgi:hypothetical protein